MQMILYFVVMFTISEANNLDVYLCSRQQDHKMGFTMNDLLKRTCKELAVKDHRVVSAETPLYKFDYYEDDKLNMNISLWNQPHGVTTDMFLIKDPGADIHKLIANYNFDEKKNSYISRYLKKYKQIFIELVFYSTGGICRKLLAVGKQVSKHRNNLRKDDICLTSNSCVVVVDMKDFVCRNEATETEKNITYLTTSPKDIIETSNINTHSTTATTPDNLTTTILASVLGVTVVLLMITSTIVVRTCWSRRDPSDAPRLPTTAPCGPFYVNMLFRDKCAQEIADIENHQYQEIGERPHQETQNQHQEIVSK